MLLVFALTRSETVITQNNDEVSAIRRFKLVERQGKGKGRKVGGEEEAKSGKRILTFSRKCGRITSAGSESNFTSRDSRRAQAASPLEPERGEQEKVLPTLAGKKQ
jgi:hypothetical protein